MIETEFIERPAMLFRAGNYPKKFKRPITVADLKRIAAGTTEAPIQLGHSEPDVKFGTAHSLVVRGAELWGTLRLHKETEGILRKNKDLRTVSVGLPYTLDRLNEVSITSSPHVMGAQMFSDITQEDSAGDDITFSLGEEEIEPMPEDNKTAVSAVEFSELQATVAALKVQNEALVAQSTQKDASLRTIEYALRRREAESTVATFSTRIPPAAQPAAVALLMSSETITFNDAEKPASLLFSEFLGLLPVHFGKPVVGEIVFSDGTTVAPEAKSLLEKMGYTDEAAQSKIVADAKKKR